MALNVKFLKGTLEAYNGIAQKDENTFYYAGSDLYLGSIKLSNGADLAAALLKVAENEADIVNLQKDIEALTGGETGSISGLIEEAVNAAKTELNTRIDGVEDRLEVVEGDYLKAADKTAIEAKITTEKERAEAAEGELNTRLTTAEGTLADVKADVDAFFADADLTVQAKDTLKELQEYIAGDQTATSEMLASIQANTQAIATEKSRAEAAEKANADAIDALEALVGETDVEAQIDAKIGALDATVSSTNVETGKGLKVTVVEVDGKLTEATLEGSFDNSYDAKGAAAQALTDAKADATTKADKALSDAKTYADGLAANYDAKGAAATAESNAKAYADEVAATAVSTAAADATSKADKALADAKTYVGEEIAKLDADVTSAAVEAGKGVQVQVTEVDGKVATVVVSGNYDAKYDAAGSANTALESAKADATTKANTAESNAKAYTDTALTWGTIA